MLDLLWALIFGLFGVLASTLLPQASVTRDAVVAIISCAVVIVALSFWPTISPLVPVRLQAHVEVRKPMGWRTVKLKSDTANLVASMREYIRVGPAPVAGMMRQGGIRSSNDPTVVEQWERQRQELDRVFASNLRDVLQQYQDRHMVNDREAGSIAWNCQDLFFLGEAATELELLAKRL